MAPIFFTNGTEYFRNGTEFFINSSFFSNGTEIVYGPEIVIEFVSICPANYVAYKKLNEVKSF